KRHDCRVRGDAGDRGGDHLGAGSDAREVVGELERARSAVDVEEALVAREPLHALLEALAPMALPDVARAQDFLNVLQRLLDIRGDLEERDHSASTIRT